MTHSTLLLLMLFASSSLVEAQNPSFFTTLSGRPGESRGVAVTPTDDGGFVAVGVATNADGDEDIYLVKTDSIGTILWTRTYGGSATDNGWAVLETPDGLLVGGSTESYGVGGFDCHLISTDRQGNRVWSTTHGTLYDDRCWAMATAPDGGILMLGESVDSKTQEDCYLIKTDESGNKLWSQTYGGEKGDRCFSMAVTDDGGYLLVGQTYSEGAGDGDVYVVKTDSQGDMEWSKTFGGSGSDVGHYVSRLTDGDYLLTGYTASETSGDDDALLIKLSASGDTAWTRIIELKGHNRALSGEEMADGGICLTGFSQSGSEDSIEALLIRTDELGSPTSHGQLLSESYGESFGYTIRATSDGGCVATGHLRVADNSTTDLFIRKLAP